MVRFRNASLTTSFVVGLTALLTISVHAQEVVRFAATAPAADQVDIYAAEDQGFFEKNGVKLELTYTGGGTLSASQLIAGAFDFALVDVATALRLASSKAPTKVVGVRMIKFPFSIMVAKDIKSIDDMVGKTIILSYRNDLNTVFWNRMLADKNIDVDKVDKTYDTSPTNRLAALTTGAAQAALLSQPASFRAIDEGFGVLDGYDKQTQGFAFVSIIGQPEWMKSNSSATRGLLKGLTEAIDWVYDPANKEKVIEIIARRTKQDLVNSEKSYDYLISQRVFNRSLRVPEDIMKNQAQTMVELGEISAETSWADVLDMSYLPQ